MERIVTSPSKLEIYFGIIKLVGKLEVLLARLWNTPLKVQVFYVVFALKVHDAHVIFIWVDGLVQGALYFAILLLFVLKGNVILGFVWFLPGSDAIWVAGDQRQIHIHWPGILISINDILLTSMIEYRSKLLPYFLTLLEELFQLLGFEVARIETSIIDVEPFAAEVGSEPSQIVLVCGLGIFRLRGLNWNSIMFRGALDNTISQKHHLITIRKFEVKDWFQFLEAGIVSFDGALYLPNLRWNRLQEQFWLNFHGSVFAQQGLQEGLSNLHPAFISDPILGNVAVFEVDG